MNVITQRGRGSRIGLALVAPLLLVACNTPIATQVTREAARSAINPVVAQRFPGVPLEPATNCIINNASANEIVSVATASATGANDTVTRVVLDVAARPDTIRCLATDGLPVLLNTL
ncbi:MAG: hypothetical protein AAF264_14555 [Pseudomonadota bacterium]